MPVANVFSRLRRHGSRRRPHGWRLVATIGALASFAACSLVYPLDGYTGGEEIIEAGGADTAETSIETGPQCTPPQLPTRPEPSAVAGTLTVVNAFRTFEFGDEKRPTEPNARGFDLDQTCTCPARPSCRSLTQQPNCDLPNGVDNNAGNFFLSTLSNFGTISTETSKIQRGEHGLLFRIRNYNGLADDDTVDFAVFNSFGLDYGSDGGATDAGAGPPRFDGTDRWLVDAKSLLGGTPYVADVSDARAYVRDFTLVAHLTKVIRIGPYTIPLYGGIFTAHLTPMGDSFGTDDGIAAGRENAQEVLTALQTVPDPFHPGEFLCGTNTIYNALRTQFCNILDITTAVADDNQDKPCDAASSAIRFTSTPAFLGAVIDNGPPKTPCGADWIGQCPTP
jgi:hypothetical protein